MSTFSVRARWVLPVDQPAISDGLVTVENGKINSVGHARASTSATHDLGDTILLPGFVNAHTHLEFSDATLPLGRSGMALPDWIRLVISNRKSANREPGLAIQQGLLESLSAGVTTIAEISTTFAALYNDSPLSNIIAFQEVIGFSAARQESVYRDLRERLQMALHTPLRHSVGISPHAPYTVHPSLLRRLVSLAGELNLPVAMHLAESRDELELISTRSGPFQQLLEQRSMWDPDALPQGSSPLDYLEILAKAPRALVIHGNYLRQEEIEFLAQRRNAMAVVFCPRTHEYFGHDPYPLSAMLAAGVQVAVGTDSRASNPDLSVLSELRWIAKQFKTLSSESILRLGTLSGAESLGVDTKIGSLCPGKWADMVAVACPRMADPYEILLQSNSRVQAVWVRGIAQRLDA